MRNRHVTTRWRLLAWAAVGALVVGACTDDGDAVPETTIAVTTTSTLAPRPSDGQLTLGLLLPSTDPILGAGLIDAARLAVREINAAGGVLDRTVRLVEADEGATEAAATEAINRLIDDNVDAIIGPASSLIALSNLDEVVDAGIVACSPTASALALDDFPDNGLFFRTIPSDSLQAIAIADVAERTGEQNIAVVFIDDAYGRPFSEAVVESLDAREQAVRTVTTFRLDPADNDHNASARAVVDSEARVVVVIAGADVGTSFLQSLGRVGASGVGTIVVNDTLRNPTTAPRIGALDPGLRERIVGVAPQAQLDDGVTLFEPPAFFAANSFDCVNLIALAALRLGSDDPRLIEDQIVALTTGGLLCSTFELCADRLRDDLEIDYTGPTGITDMLFNGDPSRARFDVFRFDDTGRAMLTSTLVTRSN